MKPLGVGTYRFDGVEYDPATGDITHEDGTRIRLRPQAASVLTLFLEHDGDLVTRATIRDTVWSHTIVEFDQSMNACVREIRRALRDSASQPRFLETLPRRGYRFIVPIERVDLVSESAAPSPERPSRLPRTPRVTLRRSVLLAVGVGLGSLLVLAGQRFEEGRAVESPRVLVIPFANSSIDPLGDTVASVLSEGLIAELSRIDPARLSVVARTSALRYAQSSDPLKEAKTDLDIDLALEGSIFRAAGFSLDLRLVDPSTQSQTWAARYPLDPDHLSASLDQIAAEVSQAIVPGITSVQDHANVGQTHAAARERALRVEYLLDQQTPDATARADTLLQEALEEFPHDLRLRTALAEILQRQNDLDGAANVASDVLRRFTSAEAHRVMAAVAMKRMDWKVAETHIERALTLAPGDPEPLHMGAFLSAYRGRRAEAIDRMTRAAFLDPVAADVVADAGYIYLWAGLRTEAMKSCTNAAVLEPASHNAHQCLIDLAWLDGSSDAGERAAEMLLANEGRTVDEGSSALRTYWAAVAERNKEGEGCRPIWAAKAMIALGQDEVANSIVTAHATPGSRCLLALALDPLFGRVRQKPRIKATLESAGFFVAEADGWMRTSRRRPPTGVLGITGGAEPAPASQLATTYRRHWRRGTST